MTRTLTVSEFKEIWKKAKASFYSAKILSSVAPKSVFVFYIYGSKSAFLALWLVVGIHKKVMKIFFFSPSKKNYFICFNENCLKMMNSAFYFIF